MNAWSAVVCIPFRTPWEFAWGARGSRCRAIHPTPGASVAGCTSHSTGLRGSSAGRRRQAVAMAVTASLLEDDEQRLAALWAQPLDDAPVGDEPPDDAIAALFSAPGGAAPRPTPRTRGSKARRPAARPQSGRLQGSLAGRRLAARSRATNRSLAVVAMLVAALVLIPVARSALTGPVNTPATHPRATADRSPASRPSASPSRGQSELRRIRATRARAHRRREHRQAIARANRRRSRVARRDRAARRARAHVRSRSAGRLVATPTAPPDPSLSLDAPR